MAACRGWRRRGSRGLAFFAAAVAANVAAAGDGGASGSCTAAAPSAAAEATALEGERAVAAAVAAAEAAGADAPPPPERAAAFLDCEGLGEEHSFWPAFRRALRSQGPLGPDTLALAYEKWSSWEVFVEAAEAAGHFGGMQSGSSGVSYRVINGTDGEGSTIELSGIMDRLDLIKVLQQVSFQGLFDTPPPWTPNDMAGFLACPVGFVLVQYVIFIVHKVRSNLPEEDRMVNWESMLNAFGLLLGIPSYALDHLESANWGVSSFDIAVNLVPDNGGYVPSYEEYSRQHPLPPPHLPSWRDDAPGIAGASSPSRLRSRRRDCSFRVALLGEHGATNMDHLSTASEALRRSCGSSEDPESDSPQQQQFAPASADVEAAHFFAYLWNLKGTTEGGALKAGLRLSWEAFWGEPLTASQGRSTSGTPQWTVARALQALRGWAAREAFLLSADLLVCCEPLWLCVLLHAARGGGRLLIRASMCLLHAFEHVFGAGELPKFWPLVRSFGREVLPRGGLSAAARISAEMLAFQTGIRAPYVPALSLHVRAAAAYSGAVPGAAGGDGRKGEVLLFRSSLPGGPPFFRMLKLLVAELGEERAPKLVHMPPGAPLSYPEIAAFRAVVILPHVPHALRLSDVYAIGSPILVPGEPLLHKFVWPFAGPFCGRTDVDLSRTVDVEAPNCSRPPYSPFAFQGKRYDAGAFHNDRRYWAQYSEWELRPHLLRFRSARELLAMASLGPEEALAISTVVRKTHADMAEEALQYWRAAAVAAAAIA